MKFIYVTDLHIRIKRPANRIGDYVGDLISKLTEVASLAIKYEAKAVLCGGDVFDSPNASGAAQNIFIDFLEMLERNDIDFYTAAGNHDIEGHNIKSLANCSLGVIGRVQSNLHVFGKQDNVVFTDNDGARIAVTGVGYRAGIDACKEIYSPEEVRSNADISILMIHSMLVMNSFFGEHVPIASFKHNFDCILSGHYHKAFSQRVGDTMFLNPGSLMRMRLEQYSVTKEPAAALIDVQGPDPKNVKYGLLKLQSARPVAEILDLENLSDDDEEEIDINNLIQMIETERIEGADMVAILHEMGEMHEFDPPVVKKVEERIKQKRVTEHEELT